jgi:hypothetical protein
MVCEIIKDQDGKTYLEFCPISKLDVISIPKNLVVKVHIKTLYGINVKTFSGKISQDNNSIQFYFTPSMVLEIVVSTYSINKYTKLKINTEVKVCDFYIRNKYFDDDGKYEMKVEEFEHEPYSYSSNRPKDSLFRKMKKIRIPIDDTIDGININISIHSDDCPEINKKKYISDYFKRIINLAKNIS